MTIESFFVHDVTIVLPIEDEDRYGDTTLIFITEDQATYEFRDSYEFVGKRTPAKMWLHQQTRAENTERAREALIGSWVGRAPIGTVITGRSRIEWPTGDLTFEVIGPPQIAYTPRGGHHVRVDLRVVDG